MSRSDEPEVRVSDHRPRHLALLDGQVEGVGGGWTEILGDLKSLLETGSSMWS